MKGSYNNCVFFFTIWCSSQLSLVGSIICIIIRNMLATQLSNIWNTFYSILYFIILLEIQDIFHLVTNILVTKFLITQLILFLRINSQMCNCVNRYTQIIFYFTVLIDNGKYLSRNTVLIYCDSVKQFLLPVGGIYDRILFLL